MFHLIKAMLVTHKRDQKALKARLTFQLFADKNLSVASQRERILHNFERFVDLRLTPLFVDHPSLKIGTF